MSEYTRRRLAALLAIFFVILIACTSVEVEVVSTTVAGYIPSFQPVTPTPASPTATPSQPILAPITLGAGRGVHGSWFELYFTDPGSPLSAQRSGGLDGPLVVAIDQARLTLDVAMYSFSLDSLRDALIRAQNRGVRVRVVMESDSTDRADPQRLIQAGIPLLGDRREGLMHDKFVVIDGSEVWMGSMNFTDNGAYADDNNLVRIRSTKIAEDYTTEFNEMFADDKFGTDTVARTPYPRVTIEDTPLDIYFAPDDKVNDSLLELLRNANQSIYFMAYSFTSDPLGEAIRSRAADGVTVAGVMDESQIDSNVGTEYDPFRQAGLDVRKDGTPGLMHHKVIIIDGQIVITGSYNFTASADERNDENLIVIYDSAIAAEYYVEFQRIHAAGNP